MELGGYDVPGAPELVPFLAGYVGLGLLLEPVPEEIGYVGCSWVSTSRVHCFDDVRSRGTNAE